MIKTITVKVTPNAKENSIKEEVDLFQKTVYKVKTTAKPKNNEANEAIIEIIAKHFAIAKSNLKIFKGQNSRNKIVEIKLSE